MKLSVQDIKDVNEVQYLLDYWFSRTDEQLQIMGVSRSNFPSYSSWLERIHGQISLPKDKKVSHYILWLVDGVPVGHSSLSQINYGVDACIHLHIWEPKRRRKGLGKKFVHLSLIHYFSMFPFQRLYCEPAAHNDPANLVLQQIGFRFLENLSTNSIILNRYEVTKDEFCGDIRHSG